MMADAYVERFWTFVAYIEKGRKAGRDDERFISAWNINEIETKTSFDGKNWVARGKIDPAAPRLETYNLLLRCYE